MKLVEDFVRKAGRRQIVVHAEKVSIGFYRALGYIETEWEEPSIGDATDLGKRL